MGQALWIGRDGTRNGVIARYRADLWRRIRAGETGLAELAELDGGCLACWCFPKHRCHAEALARTTTTRYAHLARDSIQTTAAPITGSIGGNLLAEPAERVDRPGN